MRDLAPDLMVLKAIHDLKTAAVYKSKKGTFADRYLKLEFDNREILCFIWDLYRRGLLNKKRQATNGNWIHSTYVLYSLSPKGMALLKELGL